MMRIKMWLVAFPKEVATVNRINLNTLMKRAIRIEERMVKGVNLADEEKRYHTLCDRIEYVGKMLLDNREVMVQELGCDYFEKILAIQRSGPERARETRLTANFCPAEKVERYLIDFCKITKDAGESDTACISNKVHFYEMAKQNNWSVLEIQQVVFDDGCIKCEDQKIKEKFLQIKVSDSISRTSADTNAYQGLRKQIESVVRCVRSGVDGAINFSDLGHHVITEIVHEFAYGKGKKLLLPVIYGDGSRARDLPVYALTPRKPEFLATLSNIPALDVGMMSVRHYELDPKVKVYWFRNQEISTGKTAAETDETAYVQSKQMLTKMKKEGKYKINFYQTGFQPAVVGFYRALIEDLMERSTSLPSLVVTPYYFLVDEYKQGQMWA